MNGPELLKKMRGNEDCWKIFLSYIQQKESVKRKRLNKLDYVFHKEPLNLQDAIEEANKNLKAKNLEKQLSLHPALNGPSRSEFSPLISPKFEES